MTFLPLGRFSLDDDDGPMCLLILHPPILPLTSQSSILIFGTCNYTGLPAATAPALDSPRAALTIQEMNPHLVTEPERLWRANHADPFLAPSTADPSEARAAADLHHLLINQRMDSEQMFRATEYPPAVVVAALALLDFPVEVSGPFYDRHVAQGQQHQSKHQRLG